MTAAAYARYSTSNQQETSIMAQLDGIRAYCDREGITLYHTPYIDEARSGTNTDRPGFQRLLADARAGLFDAVVVYDISRGSRDVADWFAFRREMQGLGVRVLSATNTLGDMDDPNAFLQELLSVGLGQHMVLQSRQKSIAGKRIRASKGLHNGGYPPFGYECAANGLYTVKEPEASAVRLIFERYAAGAPYGRIVEEVAALGVRSRFGNRLEVSALHDILTNERYTGVYIWADREERHMHKHVGRDNPDKIVIEDAIPPIVSKELFHMAQTRLASNKGKQRTSYRQYLLSGLIRCGECGSAMCGTTVKAKGHEYPRYVCQGKRLEKKCHLRNIDADKLDAYIARALRESVLSPTELERAARRYADTLASQTCMADDIRAEMRTLERKNRELTLLAIDVGATPEMKKQLIEYEKHRQELEKRLSEVEEPPVVSYEEILAHMTEDTKRLADDPSCLREMVLRYIKSIAVYDMKIEIVWAADFTRTKKQPSDDSSSNGCNIENSPGAHCRYVTTIPRDALTA